MTHIDSAAADLLHRNVISNGYSTGRIFLI
jgi:hypothetical protein